MYHGGKTLAGKINDKPLYIVALDGGMLDVNMIRLPYQKNMTVTSK